MKLGYEKEVILDKLSYFELNDEGILYKELCKIMKRYSTKYEGNELEYKVISYLYKKDLILKILRGVMMKTLYERMSKKDKKELFLEYKSLKGDLVKNAKNVYFVLVWNWLFSELLFSMIYL